MGLSCLRMLHATLQRCNAATGGEAWMRVGNGSNAAPMLLHCCSSAAPVFSSEPLGSQWRKGGGRMEQLEMLTVTGRIVKSLIFDENN